MFDNGAVTWEGVAILKVRAEQELPVLHHDDT